MTYPLRMSVRSAVLLAAGTFAVACTSTQPLDDASALSGRALVGGFPARDARFDAIGAVAVATATPSFGDRALVPVCTGTLIGPRTVVTAKHCLDSASGFGSDYRLVFTIGPDGAAPRRVVEVLTTEGAPHDHGGYTGYGRDVGILQLAEPVEGVQPVRVDGVSDVMVGTDMLLVGYGASDHAQTSGERRIGFVNLKARRGLVYELLLGSFEAYYEFETGQPLPPECVDRVPFGDARSAAEGRENPCHLAEQVRVVYEAYRLEQLDEVATGSAPNDAQPCDGDSGGPLLTSAPSGALTVHAVASGGLANRNFECAHGGIYASFSAPVLTFLRDALAWRDPCAGLPEEGACEGDVAHRCTLPREGGRRRPTLDCARIGSHCRLQADGVVGCGMAATDLTPSAPPEPASL